LKKKSSGEKDHPVSSLNFWREISYRGAMAPHIVFLRENNLKNQVIASYNRMSSIMDIFAYGANIPIPPPNQINFFRPTQRNSRDHTNLLDCFYDVSYPIGTNNYGEFISNILHRCRDCPFGCLNAELSKQANESFFLKIFELSPVFLVAYGKYISGKTNNISQSQGYIKIIDTIINLYRKSADQYYERRSCAIIALYLQDDYA
jgi:hypothetical protein